MNRPDRSPGAAEPRRIRPRVQLHVPPGTGARAVPGDRSTANGAGPPATDTVFDVQDLVVSYGPTVALAGVSLEIRRNLVTAVIGPSGCGKTTFLRSLNRMSDSIPGLEIGGRILYHGHDLHGPGVDRVEVRRRIGMVFQKPNPFAKSIYDNIAWAPRNLGMKADIDGRVERALRSAALWDEVKDRLRDSALGLSGGQQQRLCIARALAIEPDVILLDEPASALDPIATASIERLIRELKREYTIVIVTHNMQQAARVADRTAFFSLGVHDGRQTGTLVEYADTTMIFTRPADQRTSDYVTGRFGWPTPVTGRSHDAEPAGGAERTPRGPREKIGAIRDATRHGAGPVGKAKRRPPPERSDRRMSEETGGDLLSQALAGQVPSALRGLTALFGMGRGVSPSP